MKRGDQLLMLLRGVEFWNKVHAGVLVRYDPPWWYLADYLRANKN